MLRMDAGMTVVKSFPGGTAGIVPGIRFFETTKLRDAFRIRFPRFVIPVCE